jgi:hypothetical protein
LTNLRVGRGHCGSRLLGRSSTIINQVSFHGRHPPMARLNETHTASRCTGFTHIALVAALTDSFRLSR